MGVRIRPDVIAANAVHVLARGDAVPFRIRQCTRSGTDDEGQHNRGLGEHGDVSCFSCHPHLVGARPHLVGADAWGKSVGRISDAIGKGAARHEKRLNTKDFFSPAERQAGDALVLGLKYRGVPAGHKDR
jgi:hypothetical protein